MFSQCEAMGSLLTYTIFRVLSQLVRWTVGQLVNWSVGQLFLCKLRVSLIGGICCNDFRIVMLRELNESTNPVIVAARHG